jgi:hypothetical protein
MILAPSSGGRRMEAEKETHTTVPYFNEVTSASMSMGVTDMIPVARVS